MGEFDERHSMERMMDIRGPSKKQQANKLYRKQHKQLDDDAVADIGARLGDASADTAEEVKTRRRGSRQGRVGSIFDNVAGAYGLGG